MSVWVDDDAPVWVELDGLALVFDEYGRAEPVGSFPAAGGNLLQEPEIAAPADLVRRGPAEGAVPGTLVVHAALDVRLVLDEPVMSSVRGRPRGSKLSPPAEEKP